MPYRSLSSIILSICLLVSAMGLLGPHKGLAAKVSNKLQKQISKWEKRAAKAPENVRFREKLCELYNKTKSYGKAIEHLAPFSDEARVEGLTCLGLAYRGARDNVNEVRVFSVLVQKQPDRFRPHFYLGQALRSSQKLNEAVESFRAAIARAPKHKPSYFAMYEIFMEQKNFYESRLVIQDMVRVFGEQKDLMNRLCQLYAKDGFLKEGIQACQKAIKLAPKTPENHIYLAQTYHNQGKTSVAQKVFTNAAKRFRSSEFAQWATGEFFFQQANYPTAVRYLQRAVKANAQSARSQLGLALSLFEVGSYEKSLQTFITSCKVDKSKESLSALRTATAKLRQNNNWREADKYSKKEYLCK